ncbi:MAG: 7-cyano-7-deazaguanine synthase [Polyangia bacterium]
MPTKVVVLLSGGIDSASVLAYYRDKAKEEDEQWEVSALFFDYGQPALSSEWKAAQAIAKHYDVPIQKESLAFALVARRDEYFGRNALFALIAAAQMGWQETTVAMGIHAGIYYDTTTKFIADLQRVLDGYAQGTSLLIAPFATYTKEGIVRWAQQRQVPLHLTYSCQRRERPCGRCLACQERRSLLAT